MEQSDVGGEEDNENKGEMVEEFFDVCNNYNNGPKKDKKIK